MSEKLFVKERATFVSDDPMFVSLHHVHPETGDEQLAQARIDLAVCFQKKHAAWLAHAKAELERSGQFYITSGDQLFVARLLPAA